MTSPRHIDKSSEYEFIRPWLNEGLLLSTGNGNIVDVFFIPSNMVKWLNDSFNGTGKKWHERRKIITPAFHFNILEKYAEIFDRLGNTVVEKLNKLDAHEDIEFYPFAILYTLDVMCGKQLNFT